MVAGLMRKEPNRGYPQRPKPWASIPSASEHVSGPLTTSFKHQSVLLYGSNHGSYQYLYTETDKLSFLTLRTMHTLRASIFDRTTQTNQKENGIIHQPILFSKQRDYGQLRKTFDADATLHSVASGYAIYTGNVWHPFLACTGGAHSLPLQ
jgi:hypothetical protein